MIDRNQLLGALRGSDLSEWALVERSVESVVVDGPTRTTRREHRQRWTIVVHDDVPNGRGSAHVEVDAASDDTPAGLVIQARQIARAAVGPAWSSRPPSAPAHVALVDPDLGDLVDAAGAIVATAPPPDSAVAMRAEVARERTSIETKQGFHATWPATRFRASAMVVIGDRSLELERTARRASDLGLDGSLAAAAADLRGLALATASTAGPCTLVLRADAMLHGGGYGVWDVFAAFADGAVDRQGLTRYRIGTPIAPGAEALDDALSITSDGALDFAIRSAPSGDEGEAVRRFPIIQRGVAIGLGLTPREAALRRLDPNGGVRNLVVKPGAWSGDIDPARPRVIEVLRLRDLAIDRYAGDANLEIGLAIEHVGGAARPIAGGTIRIDLVAALAGARRTAGIVRRGAYQGPASVLIDNVVLV